MVSLVSLKLSSPPLALLFSPVTSFDAMLIVYNTQYINYINLGGLLSRTTAHFLQDRKIRKNRTVLHDTVITAVADHLL